MLFASEFLSFEITFVSYNIIKNQSGEVKWLNGTTSTLQAGSYVYICSYMCVCKCVLWYSGVYVYASVHVYMHACMYYIWCRQMLICLYVRACVRTSYKYAHTLTFGWNPGFTNKLARFLSILSQAMGDFRFC